MKILVVDDVAYSRIIVRKALERHGFEVVQASSGAEALRTLKAQSDIALVVSDLMMPDINGVELAERAQSLIRSRQGASSVAPLPFVLLTASPNPKLLIRAKKLGCADVMVKPLDSERLLKTIRKHFPGELKEQFNYADTLAAIERGVAEALKTQDRKAARMIRDALQEAMDKIDPYLEKAAKKEEEAAEDSENAAEKNNGAAQKTEETAEQAENGTEG